MFWNKKNMYKKNYTYVEDPFEQQKEIINGNKEVIVFDVGASVGNVSEKYTKLFENSLVYSFEPYSKVFEKLYRKSEINNKIKPNKLAFGNKNATEELNINSFNPTNSFLDSHENASYFWGDRLLDTVKKEEVKVITIDKFCKENGIDKIDILKLDTQGTEYSVLQGASTMLKKKKIFLIYMEIILVDTYVGQKKFPEITNLMSSFGFRLFNIYSPMISSNKELNQVDAIFILNEGFNE